MDLESIKKSIRPDGSKRDIIEKKLSEIGVLIKKRGVNAEAMLGGSFAKDTHLKGDYDVDIFVRFSKEHSSEDISSLLEEILSPLSPEKVHGSRDYFKIRRTKDSPEYEIIPVLEINKPGDARNITDMSPLHVDWVNNNGKDLKDDIRLAKQFCKARGIYGAESYIQGMSGHVLDILVIYYGGFMQLLKAASRWKEREIIDYYDFHKGDALRHLNRSKTVSPLIVVDPISPDRNASAALGKERYELFKNEARRFLQSPDPSFFKKAKITKKKLIELYDKDLQSLIIIDAEADYGKEDVVGGKILKAYHYILNKLINNSFEVHGSGWEWNKKKKTMIWFIVPKKALEKEFMRVGPPADQRYHAELFRKKHFEVFEEEGRLYAKVKRDYTDAVSLIKSLIESDQINEKLKHIKVSYF